MSNPGKVDQRRRREAVSDAAEEALVNLAVNGDRAAFGRLVRLYQRRAVSVAYRLLGNIEDASDVSQEAFVRAFRSLSQLHDPSRFGPWLLRTVSNLALNFRRGRAARAALSLSALDGSGRGASGAGGAEASIVARADVDGEGPLTAELHEAVSAALASLPEKQRLALVLFSVEGLPQKEVAEIMECSVELVKWNVFQARKKLKELLEPFL